MENVSTEEGTSWRDKTTKILNELGVVVFDPYKKPFVIDTEEGPDVRTRMAEQRASGDYSPVAERMRQIRSFDLNLVDRSDFIIAKISPSKASWGSAEEIVTAVRMKKPIFLTVDGGKKECPFWIFGMFPHEYIFNTIDDLLKHVSAIDAGTIPMDSRWKLLRKEYR